ncbi:MAG TPA: histidine kinase dimerization/phosphoacceptor domain -containing protein [Hyphomicrobiales bacterium]|nr:histidine kinase dimerization/phosphoacceptor domain -containing protein [Hyphomicrobiales bacterium]
MPRSLRGRLVLLLLAANLPAAVLALLAALHGQHEVRLGREQAVVQRAEIAGTRIQLALAVAGGLLDTFAADPDVTAGGTFCPAVLSGALAGRSDYATLLVGGPDGTPLCVAGDPTARVGAGDLKRIAAGDRGAALGLLPPPKAGGDGDYVYVARAAKAPDGQARALAATLRNAALRNLLAVDEQRGAFSAVMVENADGHVIARIGPTQGTITVNGPSPEAGSNLSGYARADDGQRYFYALRPVANSSLLVLATAPEGVIGAIDWMRGLTTLGVPLLMLSIAIAVAFLGVDRLVLRWIRQFGAASLAYGRGDYSARLHDLGEAPHEIGELGHSFNTMAERVEERSNAANLALESKSRLLRELHHRVKNNFQMIASLLALQRREMPGVMRDLLRVPEDRVLAMASAYKASYASGEIGRVELVELMRDVAAQLRQSFRLATPMIQVGGAPEGIAIDLDRAVPLGLLVSEMLTAALVRPEPGPIRIEISDADPIGLTIAGADIGRAIPEAGLARRLINAYLAQLGARLDTEPERITLVFPAEAGAPLADKGAAA